jgi:hypothetical protein
MKNKPLVILRGHSFRSATAANLMSRWPIALNVIFIGLVLALVSIAGSRTKSDAFKEFLGIITSPGIGIDRNYAVVRVLTTPRGGPISGSVSLAASCSDLVSCKNVTWEIDGYAVSGALTASPYSFSWDSTKFVDGSHVITALAVNAGGSTETAAVSITTNNGVSPVHYYVSSNGSDSNNGTSSSTPWQTIAKVNAGTYHGGDTISFLSGDTQFLTATALVLCGPNAALLTGGGNPSGAGRCRQNVYPGGSGAPLTITTYGGGSCDPIAGITSGCVTLKLSDSSTLTRAIQLNNLSNAVLEHFVVIGGTTAVLGVLSGNGIEIVRTTQGGTNPPVTGITVQNNLVRDFADEIYAFQYAGFAQSMSCTIQNNFVTGTSPTTTIDLGIWVRFANNSCNVVGNLVTNIGGHVNNAGSGILIADNAADNVSEFNVVHHISANSTTCGGPAGNWAYNATHVTIQFNEGYLIGPVNYTTGCDWANFDFDGGVSNSFMQYNYSHQSFGPGILLYNAAVNGQAWTNNVIRYNISEGDGEGNIGGSIAFGTGTNFSNNSVVYIYNNTIWQNNPTKSNSNSQSPIAFSTCPGGAGSIVANNIFGETNNSSNQVRFMNFGFLTCSKLIWKSNDWYNITGSGTLIWGALGPDGTQCTTLKCWQDNVLGGDAGATTANPQLDGAGDGGTCNSTKGPPQPCPMHYAVRSGSPMVGAGADLTVSPYNQTIRRDFYGNSVPHHIGTGWNIGADGGSR